FRMTANWPDGEEEVLLNVPRYDFNWQTNYRLVDPITLPPDFAVTCDASFDNSAGNPFNPDPTATVRWGDQSFEEMMLGLFEIAAPRGSFDTPMLSGQPSDAAQAEARALAQRLFEKHDDGDGTLRRGELPQSFAVFAFDRYDLDDDQLLTEDEVFEAALADEARRF
ncbi:MAG: hypothetical protein AAF266_15275, partial [Planctomycetota bacterium]